MKRAIALLLPIATWLACVGDDPVIGGPKPGERLGPCLADKTCNAGLECRDEVCLRPGEPSPVEAGADASTGDAAEAETGGPTCPTSVVAEPGIACPGAPARCNPANEFCCVDPGVSACLSAAGGLCNSGVNWSCDGPHHCSGMGCCADLTVRNGMCPREFTSTAATASECSSAGPCSASGKTRLCRGDGDCSGETGNTSCRPSAIYLGGTATPIFVGVCHPP